LEITVVGTMQQEAELAVAARKTGDGGQGGDTRNV
jgi:hypothetical protein